MILSRFGWWMLMVSVAVLPLGCSAFEDDNDDDRDNAPKADTRDDLPKNADRVVQAGKGEDIDWESKGVGTVYLLDRETDKVVYMGSIRQGHRLKVDASKGEVFNNGVEITPTRKINDDNGYNLYFLEN